MNAQSMWTEYASKLNLTNTPYEAWRYGANPDGLLELTLSGKKTATASAFLVYEHENSPVPQVGCYSVILNSKDEAKCIIRTSRVSITPFKLVTPEHAKKEGEGDLSLEYWREVHKHFFTVELTEIGREFDEDTLVVCEEFEVVYKA